MWNGFSGSKKIGENFTGTNTEKASEYKRGARRRMVQNGCAITK